MKQTGQLPKLKFHVNENSDNRISDQTFDIEAETKTEVLLITESGFIWVSKNSGYFVR